MALVKCKECNGDVSTNAKTCPKCGAPAPKPEQALAWGALIAIAVVVIGLNKACSGPADDKKPAIAATPPLQDVKCELQAAIGEPVSSARPFQVKIQTEIRGEPFKPMILGYTNLPVGTKLLVTLERAASSYRAQSDAVVKTKGCFVTAQFGKGDGPINPGEYKINVTMPVAPVQPATVQEIIGKYGRNISGPFVHPFQKLGKLAEYNATITFGAANPQLDQADKQKATEEAKAAQAKLRQTVALMVTSSIKANLRNPSSAEWVNVLSNDDGTVICVVLRAQNGFGGMNVENYAVVDGKLHQNDGVWNRRCAGKTLHDLTWAVR